LSEGAKKQEEDAIYDDDNSQSFKIKKPHQKVQKFISVAPDTSPSDPIGQKEIN
jgi:hypothetical protein